MLKPLLVALALSCTAGVALGAMAALLGRRRSAHAANAMTLGGCAAGSVLALGTNPDSGANALGLAMLAGLALLALASVAAARADAAWRWFWLLWLTSATCAGSLLYLWLFFRIF